MLAVVCWSAFSLVMIRLYLSGTRTRFNRVSFILAELFCIAFIIEALGATGAVRAWTKYIGWGIVFVLLILNWMRACHIERHENT